MNTFSAIIDRWPDPAPVILAADLGEEPGTVRQWRNRNVLPDRVWLSVVEAAQRREIGGVTLELLAAIARAKAVPLPMSGTECRGPGEDKSSDKAA